MSSEVWIVLIVAAAVVIVLVVFRDRLRQFGLTANRRGLDVKLTGQPPEAPPAVPGTTVIRGNLQRGTKHRIDLGSPATVEDNVQRGVENEIRVGPVDEKR